ncbi:MAG: PIG-L deacetylase family protein [Nocardioidaceae bacterium]
MASTRAIEVTPSSRFTEPWRRRLSTVESASPYAALGLAAGATVLVLGAHPDDETVGLGATIAWLTRRGITVHVMSMTSGAAALDHVAHVVDVGQHGQAGLLAGLAARRRAELGAACRELGVSAYDVLELPDGGLRGHVPRMTDLIESRLLAAPVMQLLTVWWEDPHPDHQAVGQAARAAATRAGLPVHGFAIWAPHWTDPATAPLDDTHLRLMATDEPSRRRRAAAIRCYQSQTVALTPGLRPILPAAVVDWQHEIVMTPTGHSTDRAG